MNCYFHPNEPAVTQCAECGRGLCRDCASAPGGNLCRNCIEKAKSEKRALLIRSIAIFAIVFVLCLSAPGTPFFVALLVAYGVAGTPCGWRALSSIQPRMFLFLPIIGWLIYFGIKLFLSYWIGSIAMPMQIVKALRAARAAGHTLAQ